MKRENLINVLRRTLYISGVVVLAGCAAKECDPNQTDLYSGFGCTVGGGYAQRTQSLSQQLKESSAASASARQALDKANAEAKAAQSTLASRRAQLKKLNGRTAALQKELTQAKAAHQLTAQQVQQAKADMDSMKAGGKVGGSPTTADLQRIQESQERMADLLGHI